MTALSIGPKYLRWISTWALLLAMCTALAQDARSWKSLARDGIHDPGDPALSLLQQPAEALSRLPPHAGGDLVDWDAALRQGLIQPRSNIHPETKFILRDTDVLLDQKGSMAAVRFPHKAHTRWLDCTNCHDKLFKEEVSGAGISMLDILDGEQCGVCHGAVAFPLSECKRCHNTPQGAVRAATKALAALGSVE